MEEFIKSDLEFEDDKLFWLVERLRDVFNNSQDNFSNLCEAIYNIWSYCKGNYWKAKDNEYYNSYKLLAKFGFDKKAVSRYKQCYERYVHKEQGGLHSLYEDFTPSKLFELLVLSDETVKSSISNGLIKPTMTVKQIREYIKTLKDGTDKAEKVVEVANNDYNEEDIPMAFNPEKEYDFEYFNRKTKNELVSICVSYQDYLKKLKSKKK